MPSPLRPATPLPALREHVRARAENRPGVYRMLGPGDEMLYVGKSVRVRSRLLSYFRADAGEKAHELIRDATRIEWEYVPNEFEALVREMKLIQRQAPRYNVQHRRKRSYAFVKVTREPAPRILPVSRVTDDGSTWFGPFPRVGRVQDAIRDLSYVMGLRDCPGATPIFFDDQLEFFGGAGAPTDRPPRCLRADLGTCLAPCCGRTSSVTYRKRVEQAVRFLEGRGREPLKVLEARMAEAVHRKDFEYAAAVRDRLERLRHFQEELAAFRGQVESLTFVYRVPGFRGSDRIYLVRRGIIRDSLDHPKDAAARKRASQTIRSVFRNPDRAVRPEGLTPWEAAEILLVARWFRLKPKELKRTTPPETWLEEKGAA